MAEHEGIQSCHDAPLLDLRYLLDNFRKSLKLWFLSGWPKTSYNPLERCIAEDPYRFDNTFLDTCVEILMHGILHLETVHNSKENNYALQKFMDDLDWVRKSTLIKDLDFVERAEETMQTTKKPAITIKQFLRNWVLRNLRDKTMCASIETLIIIEKGLLKANYYESAFLRTESYAHAFIIGLSAFELNQYSLLSKIDKSLYTYTNSVTLSSGDTTDGVKSTKHKRTSSHPNFSLSLPRANLPLTDTVETSCDKNERKEEPESFKHKTVFPVFRKTKSLPIISITSTDSSQFSQTVRPRSKTLNTIKRRSLPKPIPSAQTLNRETDFSTSKKVRSPAHNSNAHNDHPSSSVNSFDSQISNSTISSSNTTNSACSSTSPPLFSTLNATPKTIARRIELIKCDDIKIWTDRSQTPKHSSKDQNLDSCTLPSPMAIKKPKSISPMNSFLSSLFGTSPTHSMWYTGDEQTEQEAASVLSSSAGESHNTMSVFDTFMPVYGKKVQSKNKPNLFEDGISTLDYKPSVTTNRNGTSHETPEKSCKNYTSSNELPRTPASCQNLTAFLQMAHLSRNNTELEKENAHFRISEAIISAIEHIKWAKSQPKNEAVFATDWLEHERKTVETDPKTEVSTEQREETILADSSEYIPFVEHSEPCSESLSAEVVGLSLISRFNNDKHMPKVSELKWLVSDEDTPQQLLPMPDSSTSANPDEHIFPPMTRGTRYWAPPRPQIIFTEHPTPNRKELIRKQNNRCAGCGMRVSPQNMSSFRYCTYFGKYHCTGCHRNQMSSTPAKILQMWDFKCYPVSVFAYRLLEQMYTYPLFHVPDLNPALYVKSKLLLDARNKRLKLKFIRNFIKACRFAKRDQSYFDTIPDYITYDIDTWSMSDFVEARNESMQRSINELIEKCENHIFHCVLCTGRGFCCEYCLRDRVIYPWEDKVFRCDHCGSCFHLNCWKAMLEVCCRCRRIWNRKNEVTESVGKK